MIKKTFGVAHYSWWRSYCFDVNKAKGNDVMTNLFLDRILEFYGAPSNPCG